MTMTAPRTEGQEGPPRPPSGPGRPSRLAPVLAAVVGVGLSAAVLGQLGSKALYVVVGIVAAAAVVWSVRDVLGPPVSTAVRRVTPSRRAGPAPSRLRSFLGAAATVVGAAAVSFAVAAGGHKALYGLVGLVAVGLALWLCWPAVLLLVRTPPMAFRPAVSVRGPGGGGPVPGADDDGETVGDDVALPVPRRARGAGRPGRGGRGPSAARVGAVLLAALGAGLLSTAGASVGSKTLLVVVGAVAVAGCLLYTRDKTLFVAFGTVCSLAFLVHKSFGGIDQSNAGGAPSLYITSFDAMLLVLYALWVAEGTFGADVRAAAKERILWVPVIGWLLMVPSLLATGASTSSGLAELLRMAWMCLLFFYVAVRVRSRAMVWAVLGGFAAFALVEIVVVLLQWKTGGVLGLSFLGVPKQLSSRITDTSQLGRPFGTIIHPDFMGAAMGAIAMVAISLGLSLRRSVTKIAALAVGAGGVTCLYLAHTRASFISFVVVLLAMVGAALAKGRLRWRTVGRAALLLLAAAVAFFPQLESHYKDNFGTGHFGEEVTSRYQLNDVAGQMFESSPLVGVGLNSFQKQMGRFETHGVIFVDNPVQNVYLLYLSETGIIGMAGVLFVGIALYNIAVRLARSRDRLFGAVGIGVSGAMAFLMFEEILDVALRQDVPLAVYWVMAGLAVACYRMAGLQGTRRRGPLRGAPGSGRAVGADAVAAPRRRHRPPRALLAAVAALPGRVRRAAPRAVAAPVAAIRATGRPATAAVRASAGTLRRPAVLAAAVVPRRRGRHLAARPPLRRGRALLLGALLVGGGSAAGAGLQTIAGASLPASVPVSQMRMVFAARTEAVPGLGIPSSNGIFVVNGDGTGLTRLLFSTGDTLYNWPQWALGGTKIVYTVRDGPPVSTTDLFPRYENLWEMNPDGSGRRPLTDYKFRAVQPKVSADGRSVLFTAQNPQYPLDAVYKLDLRTLEATNLSQTTQPDGAADADPKWTPDGNVIVSSTEPNVPGTSVDEMNPDGSNRQVLVGDGNFNTDPEISPDGSAVAYSAYDGTNPVAPGFTPDPSNPDDVPLNPEGWYIKVKNLSTGAVDVLNAGDACASGTTECQPSQSSGWKPVWSPDGKTIAWTGRIDKTTTCICAENVDGSDPRVLFQSSDFTIKWFDWTAPGGHAPSTAVGDKDIGSQRSTARLLLSAEDLTAKTPELLDEPVDMMGNDPAGAGTTANPSQGSWSAQRRAMVFVADAGYDPSHPAYGPPPPPGQQVHEHFTLQQLQPTLAGQYPANDVSPTRQVFMRRPDGSVVQLTTPWTEDWQDAMNTGDSRSNTDPVISPNGRYVVFVSHSTLTGESALLRMDLDNGQVLSLTNGTAGALPVNDNLPAFSPDSSKIAFTWTYGGATDVYVMNASDGTQVTAVTDDNAFDMDPAWSPDGRSIVYSRHDGTIAPTPGELDTLTSLPRDGWALVDLTVATGAESVLTQPSDSPTWRPVFSPDGTQIAYVGWQHRAPGVFLTTPQGGPAHPLLITPFLSVTKIDWKPQ